MAELGETYASKRRQGLLAHRRLFEKDEVRFFVGQVEAYEAGIVKATGHSYVRDIMEGQVLEKAEKRTKILSLSSGTLLVYHLPDTVALDTIHFKSADGQLSLTDGRGFSMNLAEYARGGRL